MWKARLAVCLFLLFAVCALSVQVELASKRKLAKDASASLDQIEATTFGRQMIAQIANLNSYAHVKAFIKQIGARLADEQRVANETRDKEAAMCNVTITQLENTVKHKQTLVDALDSWIKNLTAHERNIPISIRRHGTAQKQANVDLISTQQRINGTRSIRVNENVKFRLKIQNAVHLGRALAAVVPYIVGELKAMGHVVEVDLSANLTNGTNVTEVSAASDPAAIAAAQAVEQNTQSLSIVPPNLPTNVTAAPAAANSSSSSSSFIETDSSSGSDLQVSESVVNEFGLNDLMVQQDFLKSERLDSLLKVVTSLAESAVMAAGTGQRSGAQASASAQVAVAGALETMRTLLVEVNKEIDAYVSVVNKREMQDMQFFAQELSELLARKQILKKQRNFHYNQIVVQKIKLTQVKRQLVEAKQEFQTQLPSLNNFKEQLATQKKACDARTNYHDRQDSRRAEERSTLQAVARLVSTQLKKIRDLIHARIEAAKKARAMQALARQQAQAAALKAAQESYEEGLRNKTAAAAAAAAAAANAANATAAAAANNGSVPLASNATANASGLVVTPPGAPNPPKPTTVLPASGPLTCTDWVKELQFLSQPIKSGVFKLRTADGVTFDGYCDNSVQDGGWLLAFKQSSFGSGTITPSPSLRGNAALLDPQFNTTTMGSLFDLPHTQMLYRTSFAKNWFITPSLSQYAMWNVSDTPRHCLLRTSAWQISPAWNDDITHMWTNATISLMDVSFPTISAVVIGQSFARASPSAPEQCMSPQCSPFRHGRYNGKCQNGSSGEGNIAIYIR